MAKFVCPECEQEMENNDEDQLANDAKQHMSGEHDKQNVGDDYIESNIEAHA